MTIKISTLIALYLYLAYFVNAMVIDVTDESSTMLTFFSPDRIDRDRLYRIKNKMGDIKSLQKDTIDRTCKTLQVRRLQKKYPTLLAHEQNTVFGDFRIQPRAYGAESVAEYDRRLPHRFREIGQYEYLLLLVDGTPYRKEIYHVPSLTYVDTRGNRYSIDDGFFGLDDYNVKGRPLIFEVREDDRAQLERAQLDGAKLGRVKLVAYEDTVRFQFPQRS